MEFTCVAFSGDVKLSTVVLWESTQPTHQKVVRILSCTIILRVTTVHVIALHQYD